MSIYTTQSRNNTDSTSDVFGTDGASDVFSGMALIALFGGFAWSAIVSIMTAMQSIAVVVGTFLGLPLGAWGILGLTLLGSFLLAFFLTICIKIIFCYLSDWDCVAGGSLKLFLWLWLVLFFFSCAVMTGIVVRYEWVTFGMVILTLITMIPVIGEIKDLIKYRTHRKSLQVVLHQRMDEPLRHAFTVLIILGLLWFVYTVFILDEPPVQQSVDTIQRTLLNNQAKYALAKQILLEQAKQATIHGGLAEAEPLLWKNFVAIKRYDTSKLRSNSQKIKTLQQ